MQLVMARSVLRQAAPIGEGCGALEFTRIADRTVVTRAWANSPLKLLCPRAAADCAWMFASTYGGGLLAGDEIALQAVVGERCKCLLGTQSATKIYRSPDGLAARQTLSLSLEAGSICVIAPHPVTCFAASRYIQRQRIELAADASLVLIDWLTSGRHAAGERWAFEEYDSRTDVFVEGRHRFRDAMRLSADDGPIAAPHRTGGFNCFAYALLLGPAFAQAAEKGVRQIEQEPIIVDPMAPLLFSASPVSNGALFRAAGTGSEIVGSWLKKKLSCVSRILGSDAWSRMFF